MVWLYSRAGVSVMLSGKMLQAAAGNSGVDTSWTLENVTYNGEGQTFVFLSSPTGSQVFKEIFFKPDGTKLYVVDVNPSVRNIHEYNLSAAWLVTSATYHQTFALTPVTISSLNIWGMFFSPDGLNLYVLNYQTGVYWLSLSTAWDISTISYSGYTAITDDTAPRALAFKPDGTKMYICGDAANVVMEYALSTAWDITTASYTTSYSTSSAPSSSFYQLCFKSDGTQMYIGSSRIWVHDLTTPWDISTASYNSVNYSLNDRVISDGATFAFKPDGTTVYVHYQTDSSTDITNNVTYITQRGILPYSLSTPWDISTISFQQPSTEFLASGFSTLRGLTLSPDGSYLYALSGGNGGIKQFSLSTPYVLASAVEVNTTSSPFYSYDTNPVGVMVHPSGTSIYVIGDAGDTVDQFTLSTAWDITTAAFYASLDVSLYLPSPGHGTFGNNGTRLYIPSEGISIQVITYNLSTPYDLSTASIGAVTNVSGVHSLSRYQSISFSPDGKTCFIGSVLDSLAPVVYSFYLSTAWNLTTAVYNGIFIVSGYISSSTVETMWVNEEGTKLYIGDDTASKANIFSFDLVEVV